jgi:hypothetical protein
MGGRVVAVPPVSRDHSNSMRVPQPSGEPRRFERRTRIALIAVVVVALAAWASVTAKSDVRGDPRLGVAGAENLPIERVPFLGYTNWPLAFSLVFLVVALALLGYYVVVSWRARFVRHELVVFAALVGTAWVDPLGNWATGASFDPRFLHFPTSLPWVNIAPGVEPLMVVVGYPFLFLTIALLARGIARRTRGARLSGTRGLVVAGLIGFGTGVVVDVAAQVFMMNAHMYVYLSHVPPALTWGKAVVPWLPILYDSSGIAMTTVLLRIAGQRNTDQTAARPVDITRGWLALSSVLLTVIALGAVLKMLGLMDSTFGGPWPFPEMIDGRPM